MPFSEVIDTVCVNERRNELIKTFTVRRKKSFVSVQILKPIKYSLPYPTFLHKDKPYSKASHAKHTEERLWIMRYAVTWVSATVDFLSAEAI